MFTLEIVLDFDSKIIFFKKRVSQNKKVKDYPSTQHLGT